MDYRTLGKTGLEISRLSFGGMSLGADDLEQAAQTVYRGFEHGINFFETATVYGGGASEKAIGMAVEEMKKTKQPFYVSSKCKEFKPDRLRATLEISLKSLNLDSIDFFTPLWAVKTKHEWEVMKEQGGLDGLLALKEEGLIRHILFTAHMESDDLDYVLEDFSGFEVMIFGYNLINHHWRKGCVTAAKKKAIGTVAMNPLGSGVIAEWADIFSAILPEGTPSVVDLAYSFVFSNPDIDTVLGGYKTPGEVDAAIAAFEQYTTYDEDQRDRLFQAMKEQMLALPLRKRRELGVRLTDCMYLVRAENVTLTEAYTWQGMDMEREYF